jgi:hypothetical protein
MVNKTTIALLIFTVSGLLAIPAYASLVPMSWGFPTFTQNNSLSSFELSDISFPTTSSGMLGTTFPTITQISNQTQMAGKIQFMSQQESVQFSYPWVSIGFSPVPSMGFL